VLQLLTTITVRFVLISNYIMGPRNKINTSIIGISIQAVQHIIQNLCSNNLIHNSEISKFGFNVNAERRTSCRYFYSLVGSEATDTTVSHLWDFASYLFKGAQCRLWYEKDSRDSRRARLVETSCA
jgi:predicted transcriptional regulator